MKLPRMGGVGRHEQENLYAHVHNMDTDNRAVRAQGAAGMGNRDQWGEMGIHVILSAINIFFKKKNCLKVSACFFRGSLIASAPPGLAQRIVSA